MTSGALDTTTFRAGLDFDVGQAARASGLVDEQQLFDCFDVQVVVEKRFGRKPSLAEVLVTRGHATVEQIDALLRRLATTSSRQSEPPGPKLLFGQLALDRGYITSEQLLRALATQQDDALHGRKPRPLGAVLGALGFISREQLQEILRLQLLGEQAATSSAGA